MLESRGGPSGSEGFGGGWGEPPAALPESLGRHGAAAGPCEKASGVRAKGLRREARRLSERAGKRAQVVRRCERNGQRAARSSEVARAACEPPGAPRSDAAYPGEL